MIVVGVDPVGTAIGVACQVKLHDPLVRHALDVLSRIEIVIDTRDKYVVDVQQQSAVGLVAHAREKFPFAER